MSDSKSEKKQPFDGVAAVAEMLRHLSPPEREKLLQNVAQKDPRLVDELRRRSFEFEDLKKLEDRALQGLLRRIPEGRLALALRKATPELLEAVYRNLPRAAVQRIREEIQAMGPQKLSVVLAAQQEIAEQVLPTERGEPGEG